MNIWDGVLTDKTCCVLITHVQSNNSCRLPVKAITELAHQRNIYSIVDIAQSVGIIPIDLQNWQADFVIGSCVKWLCGGPGSGFLWAQEDIADHCEPLDVGWLSHQKPHGIRHPSL